MRKRDHLVKKKQLLEKQNIPTFSILNLDENKAEHLSIFNKAKDQFERFAGSQGQLKVTKIQKINNIENKIRYLVCLSHLWKPTYTKPKFHGTDSSTTLTIAKEGFRFGNRNTGLFGGGVYFATGFFFLLLFYCF